MQSDRLVLYSYWRSSCSWRVRLMLEACSLQYDLIPVNLLSREHLDAAHLARNPMGSVPVLAINDTLMTQSLAILDYLANTASANSSNVDWRERARQMEMALVIVADTQPLQNLHVQQMLRSEVSEGFAAKWACDVIRKGLTAFDRLYTQTDLARVISSQGRDVRMAEVCLIPQVYNAIRFGLDAQAEFPRLFQVYEAVNAAYPQAHPSSQPDSTE